MKPLGRECFGLFRGFEGFRVYECSGFNVRA